jgi:hypothetical protein
VSVATPQGSGQGENAEKLQKQMGSLANQQRAKANWELLSAELDVSLRRLPWDCRLSDTGTEAGGCAACLIVTTLYELHRFRTVRLGEIIFKLLLIAFSYLATLLQLQTFCSRKDVGR